MSSVKYYQVGLSGEYAKRNGKFSRFHTDREVNRHLLNDGLQYPAEAYKDLKLIWSEDQKDTKVLTDYPIVTVFGRVISQKLKIILEKFSDKDIVYFHPIDLI